MILTHYFPVIDSEKRSFSKILTSSITEYSVTEQQSIANKLSLCPGRALRRFDQFNDYILKRQQTENWLYTTFLKIGGHPLCMHPFYFILGEYQQLKNDFGINAQSIQLDTNTISYDQISFTLGDSVGMFFSSAPNQIYLLDQLENLLSNPELIAQQMKPLKNYHHYIEAQLWNKDYLKEIIE